MSITPSSARTRRFVAALSVLALAVAVIGTVLWHNAPDDATPAPSERLTIAATTYLGAALVHVAAAQDYFRVEGLEVTLQMHTSGRSALDAVLDRKADIATVGDTPLMFAIARKQPVAVVATLARAVRSHAIVARRDRGISTPADLKGRTLGGVTGTDSQFVLNMILASNGIAPGAVTL